MSRDLPFEMTRRPPAPHLAGTVIDICSYRETAPGAVLRQREAASLVVPLVISLGTPFAIALGREPEAADRQPSFASGLFPGPVDIVSDGGANCVQVNFTPAGAFRLFGGAIAGIAGRMVAADDIFGRDFGSLRQQLAETEQPAARFALVEQFIAVRLGRAPSPEIAHAWRQLARTSGSAVISSIALDIGWSRKHFARRFAAETGVTPKTVARMMRFRAACRLAAGGGRPDWAMVAAEAGYADQAHLTREFVELAGETPGRWATRQSAAA